MTAASGASSGDCPQHTKYLSIMAENECHKLHPALGDLSSLLQALGQLADHFIADCFMDCFADTIMLMEK